MPTDPTNGGGELHGTDAADRMEGGTGNDRLYGRDGDDLLIDGAGYDRLHGGAGADIFRFVAGDGRGERIEDFTVGDDMIDISAWGVTSFKQLTLRVGLGGDGNWQGRSYVEFGNESLSLEGYHQAELNNLSASDFIFA